MDKTEILEILNDWNYWNRDFPPTHPRESYGNKIDLWMKSDEVVVIKGVRRSGKSTLMINRIKHLKATGVDMKNVLFVNFEDPRFINHLDLSILEKIKSVYMEYLAPDAKPYLFLDEIQNVTLWEKWVNKEYELGLSHIVLSGSNSSLLSSEIASALSGRYLSIDVYPLSFSEYIGFKGMTVTNKLDLVNLKIELQRAFEVYMKYGAFPKTLEYTAEQTRELLVSYKDSILLKDIVARYKLKEFGTLEEIAAFLLSNTGIIQSITKIKNHFHISYDMARNYVEYLCKAYMLFEVPKFDYSLRKQSANDKKYYSIDLGLSNILRVPNLQHRGSNLETIVFLELQRRGYKVYYYKTNNGWECDFLIEKDQKIEALIQVTLSLKEEKTKKRELRVFAKTVKELNLENVNCMVISEDTSKLEVYDGMKIEIINVIEWLL
ncbi:MAG: ATP-binding protein [Sulfurovum sp.]|nr:ATP-binding protein [Sulfurovum sp.]